MIDPIQHTAELARRLLPTLDDTPDEIPERAQCRQPGCTGLMTEHRRCEDCAADYHERQRAIKEVHLGDADAVVECRCFDCGHASISAITAGDTPSANCPDCGSADIELTDLDIGQGGGHVRI